MMIRHRQLPTERDLAALADGSLPAARRVRVERAVAASPELQAIVAAQRRALAAIDDAAAEQAPAALRARLELMSGPRRRGVTERPRQARSPFRPVRLLPVGALAAALAGAVLVVTLGGGVSSPTVADAAVLATRPAVASVPSTHTHGPTLAVRAAGLPFPYWDDRFGFRAVGVRHDRFDGRATTTVFYKRGDVRVAYTIVSGKPLSSGARTQGTVRDGVAVWTLNTRGMRVATWLRRGHSCVLAGRHVPAAVLVSLASWRGDGRIPY
jgi:anti-sigma factor RsiW